MASGLNSYPLEALPEEEFEYENEFENEFEFQHESEFENEYEAGEQFFGDIASRVGDWVSNQWTAVQTPGSWQRKAAIAAAKSGLPALGTAIGTRYGGSIGGKIG